MTRNFESSLTFKKTIKKTDFEVQHRFETEVFKQVSSTTSILEERKKLRENSVFRRRTAALGPSKLKIVEQKRIILVSEDGLFSSVT